MAVMNRCLVWIVALALCTASLMAQSANTDPIGHRRLVQAHAYAANAEALVKGGAALLYKHRVEAAEGLDDKALRHELRIMVEAVRVKFTAVQLEPVQNNVFAHIRMARHQLTDDKVERSLDAMQKTVRKHRKHEKKYSPTGDMQDQVEAINAVLRVP